MSYPMGGQSPPDGSQPWDAPQQQQQQWQPQSQGGYQPQWQGQPQWHGVGYGRPPPPSSQHYGDYGQQFQHGFQANAWEAMNMSGPDELSGLFHAELTGMSNGIQADTLFKILNQSAQIRNYYKINWSLELCKIMVAMLDRSKDGCMQYPEFQELLQCLTFWHSTFHEYDTNRTGFMETNELGRVINDKYGYTLSVKAMEYLLKRYSKVLEDGTIVIALDDFIALSVRLRAYTEAFRARDRQAHGNIETGRYEFTYDDFIQTVMCL